MIFELNHIVDRYLIFRKFHKDKIQNLESIYTVWNYLYKEAPKIITGNK